MWGHSGEVDWRQLEYQSEGIGTGNHLGMSPRYRPLTALRIFLFLYDTST